MAALPTTKPQLERLLSARGWGATLLSAELTPTLTPTLAPTLTPKLANGSAPAVRPHRGLTLLYPAGAGGGVTSAALRAAAQALAAPAAVAAWVDGTDALDPESAARAGLHLDRLLWLPAAGAPLAELLALTQMLLAAARFHAVVLDVLSRPMAELERWPRAAWFRLLRGLERHRRSQLWVLAPAALPAPSAVTKVAV